MTDKAREEFEWCYEHDGYGTIGVSFVCPHCSRNNRFVDDAFEMHKCENCHKESMPDSEVQEY